MQTSLLDVPNHKSPLRYPGGKTRAWKFFEPIMPDNIKMMVSPFFGGGGLELRCAANDILVVGSDKLEPLVNFWTEFQKDSERVVSFALEKFPLPLDEYAHFLDASLAHKCKDLDGKELSDAERASIFLCINKQSWSGLTMANGPFMPKPDQVEVFRKSMIRARDWSNDNFSIGCSDYKVSLEKYGNNSDLIYLDPPYVGTENLYGDRKKKDQSFDHHEFFDKVSNLKSKWIVSYKKHDLVMDLYKDYDIIEYSFGYVMASYQNNKATELFIKNF